MTTHRPCAVADLEVGDFIEVPDYGDLYGEIKAIMSHDKTVVGDGSTDWFTLRVRPHGDVILNTVGPKRGTDQVVRWSR